jgi:L-rhamnose isomerase
VVIVNDDLLNFAQEIVRMDALKRVNIGLDYFDASINRIGAYVIGVRSVQKAFLFALLEPLKKLREYEDSGRGFERLALLEECKVLPWTAVWDYFCLANNVPSGLECIENIAKYEKDVLSGR